MVSIVPSITASTPEEYQAFLKKVSFAKRLHLDFSDGELSPRRLINLEQAYWPAESVADIHLMYKDPTELTETLISMAPNLVILHAEAAIDLGDMFTNLKEIGIKIGLAFLQATPIDKCRELIPILDHVLIFTGKLGYYGGVLDQSALAKAALVKQIKPNIEVAVDGGINETNVGAVIKAGADVLIVGGYLQNAADSQSAYAKLLDVAGGKTNLQQVI